MSRTVFVTGATAGIGRACAEVFAAAGNRLIVVGRRRERLDELVAELSPQCPVLALELDVQDKAAIWKAVEGLPAEFRDVTVLVNNAGLALGLAPAHQADLTEWETMIQTNILGLTWMTSALLPGMVQRKRGHIINISSIAGSYPYSGGNVYGATKAFVNRFSQNLRCDLGGTGVRVTNIEPGMVETEFSLVRFKGDATRAGKTYDQAKPLTAGDIAQAVKWVCEQPEHVNVNSIEIMPTTQAWGGFTINRGG